ncbi:hypothetical protein C8J57DRAFT_1243283 [Mycena rebaudengoi]|nr:hypothetical protein C8J57DRAFT_1243283 [Mycena rebaudengoi]
MMVLKNFLTTTAVFSAGCSSTAIETYLDRGGCLAVDAAGPVDFFFVASEEEIGFICMFYSVDLRLRLQDYIFARAGRILPPDPIQFCLAVRPYCVCPVTDIFATKYRAFSAENLIPRGCVLWCLENGGRIASDAAVDMDLYVAGSEQDVGFVKNFYSDDVRIYLTFSTVLSFFGVHKTHITIRSQHPNMANIEMQSRACV